MFPEYSPEENYWIHVELFPGIASQYSAKALNELQVVFSNAHAGEIGNLLFANVSGPDTRHLDALTSEIAFPYTAGDCEEFTDLLERSKGVFRFVHSVSPSLIYMLADRASSPNVVTFVARLWATVGGLHASTNSVTPREPIYCSKPPVHYPFQRGA